MVSRHGYVPVGNRRHVHPSDLLGSLPFDVAFIAGRSLSFLREARALLPDEIPIVYEIGADAGKADTLDLYAGALGAGAALVSGRTWSAPRRTSRTPSRSRGSCATIPRRAGGPRSRRRTRRRSGSSS